MSPSCLLGLVVVAGLAAAPFFLSPYQQSFLLLLYFYAAIATSWSWVGGYIGYFSFGHVAFFGLGGYVSAILIQSVGVHWIAAAACGGLASGLAALAIGVPSLRMRGATFAIVTLAFSQALKIGVYAAQKYTGGGHGMSLPPIPSLLPVYYAFLGAMLLAFVVSWWLSRSEFGLRAMAIRDDETAAEAIGIRTGSVKLRVFAISAVFVGVCGGIYVWYLSYVHPEEMFSLKINITMIVMALFGGAGTTLGPIIGAVSLFSLSEILWANYPVLHQLLFGAAIVLLVHLLPDGVMGGIAAGRSHLQRRRGR